MNFKENESATKLRGGYYTKPEIARFLLRWVNASKPSRLLEPSCGDGVFFRELGRLQTELRTVKGFEIDASEATKAEAEAKRVGGFSVDIQRRDFLGWALENFMAGERFDAVVGNPPFIRYQYCEPEFQEESERVFAAFGLRFTRHTNAWVPFVVASVALLEPGGRLAMVVPAELLHVLHADSLRNYLARECNRVLLFDPQELWFEDALQGAVLLLAQKKGRRTEKSEGVAILPTRTNAFLSEDPERHFVDATYANGGTIEGKWTRALLTPKERQLLKSAEDAGILRRFGTIADADVGIVTGANKFFLVSDEVVDTYNLGRWAHPMFGRSDHVPGVIYDRAVHEANRAAGRPSNFLWFTGDSFDELPPKVREYLKSGEEEDLHKRYKCRIRKPWYAVPSVYTTPVGMLKRSHHYPRLIHNQLEAFTTDTAYRIKAHEGVQETDLVYSFVNSATALSAELEGRHYGGGVLELVPSEIEKVLVPLVSADVNELRRLDADFRSNRPADQILATQDQTVLRHAGFSDQESATLREAWVRLRNRRQRK